MQIFKLIQKIKLTPDVYEMKFLSELPLDEKAGQFITFILDNIGGRAYSILESQGLEFKLIIKRLENGKGGSKYICDRKIGEELKGVGPTGKFVLSDQGNNKLFLGTGTGFVPLYNMIISLLEKSDGTDKIGLVFGVRLESDLFYLKELKILKDTYKNFSYTLYLSRGEGDGYQQGYITNYLTEEKTGIFDEFYICGMPNMIDSVVLRLKDHEVNDDNIFTEKY